MSLPPEDSAHTRDAQNPPQPAERSRRRGRHRQQANDWLGGSTEPTQTPHMRPSQPAAAQPSAPSLYPSNTPNPSAPDVSPEHSTWTRLTYAPPPPAQQFGQGAQGNNLPPPNSAHFAPNNRAPRPTGSAQFSGPSPEPDARAATPRRPAQAPAPTPETVSPPPAQESFVEPGRQGATFSDPGQRRPTAPHLDPRVAGLDSVPKRRRFARSRPTQQIAPNPTSDGLNRPIPTPRRISVVGLKGGVGKTTISVLMSQTMARTRREPVLLLDSDTTYGSLLLRLGVSPVASAHDIAAMGDPGAFDVLKGAISRTGDGVWVLPSGRTPAQSAAFNESTYINAVRSVYRYFPISITDCGTGIAGPLMQRVVSASHTLVIATSPSMDGVLASHNALHWLESIGYGALAQRSIVAISNIPPEPVIDMAEARARLAPLCRAVMTIPADAALTPGSVIDYGALAEPTRRAAYDLSSMTLESSLSV